MAALVRVVSQQPNQHMLVGFPGISATIPRLEGKVEIRPSQGVSAPVQISFVSICLQRTESIHPPADNMVKKHLAAPRKEIAQIVGRETLLYRAPHGNTNSENIYLMDLPFVLFIPFGRGGEASNTVPAASLSLPSRTAETKYDIIVTIHFNATDQKKYAFPIPIPRYDTLSTFGMYNRPETAERTTDHLVYLGISLPRWSYGPLDPITLYVKLSPNRDWLSKARKVKIKRLTIGVDEEVVYNHEGDEPLRRTKTLNKQSQTINQALPDDGYWCEMGMVFPSKDLRESGGVLPRASKYFPSYQVNSFTTIGTLYKIEYYLTVKAEFSSAKDILLRQPIVVCPYDHQSCKEEMGAIEQAAKDASHIDPTNPYAPASVIVRMEDPNALNALGMTVIRGERKPLIL